MSRDYNPTPPHCCTATVVDYHDCDRHSFFLTRARNIPTYIITTPALGIGTGFGGHRHLALELIDPVQMPKEHLPGYQPTFPFSLTCGIQDAVSFRFK